MKQLLGFSIDETSKRRWKRLFRRRRREALSLSQQADEKIESLLIRRFDRLISVRRFILMWVSLFVILLFIGVMQLRGLSAYYQQLVPVRGGIYNEGTVGTFTNANPIYTTGLTDLAVSRLVFSGLLKYDNDNHLVGDLAESWQLDEAQKRYVVHLKKNIKWHDGHKFTADDVVYTYGAIQDVEAQSPFYTTWRGIKVTKQDNYTVYFDLPNTLSSFPHSLTNGILPAHVLKKTPMSQLRSATFNSHPIGTGPFEWRFITVSGADVENRQQRISLAAFKNYWAGRPKLDSFNIITFSNEDQMLKAFKKKQLNAVSGLNSIPPELTKNESVHVYATPLTGAVMTFFNLSRAPLDNANVRRAMVTGVDSSKLIGLLPYPGRKLEGPLLPNQFDYDESTRQMGHDEALANQLLDKEGWVKAADGLRVKDGKQLTLVLRSQDTPEYTKVAQFLQKEWSDVGVKVNVFYHNNEDLQRTFIAGHDYDILLYGISIGADRDVFAYWHSSQAGISSSGHLNLSEYKSRTADLALESARTRSDKILRDAKYRIFLSTWRQDAPALALYEPNFLYVTNGPVFGSDRKAMNTGADRFYNVHEWMVRQQRQTIKTH